MVVLPLANAQIYAVDIDGIVHHAVERAVLHQYVALALHEVRGVRLRGEIAALRLVRHYAESVEVQILRALRHESHALGVVHL